MTNRHLATGLVILLVLSLTACQRTDQGRQEDGADEGAAAEGSAAGHVVEITAVDYAFDAPDTIPAGWVTFRMKNEGTESHHFHFRRLPEGRTFAAWREGVKEPVDSIWQLQAEGKLDSVEVGAAIDQAIPSWADSVPIHGGVGLVAPGRTGQATHRVEPGHYLLICVIRAPDGRAHHSLGMVDGLVAVESSAGRSPPEPDVVVRGAGREIRRDDTLTAGRRTVGFRVEQVPDGLRNGTGGDYSVWLARLADTTDAEDVRAWDYQNPAPYESLGGFEYVPPKETAYITADFESGRYVWIWFYLGWDPSPLVETFTVE